MNRGRVYLDNTPKVPFELFQASVNDNSVNFNGSIKSILSDSKLSDIFFSRQNIDNLHYEIINRVFQRSNGQFKIGKQSEIQLQIVMRSIFLQEAKHLNCNFKKQISDLNEKVLEFCIPRIMTEINQFLGYKKDVNTMPVPLAHPQNLSGRGKNILTTNIGF
jgi:hypothetical protein